MPTRIGLANGEKLNVDVDVNEAKRHLATAGGTDLQSFNRFEDQELVYVNPAHVVSLEPYDAPSRTPRSQ